MMSEDSGSSSPVPARHRADDDMEALASGSFAPFRTPNGEADLLSEEAAALAADAPTTPFSIDDGDDEDALPHDPSAAAECEDSPNFMATAIARHSSPSGNGKPSHPPGPSGKKLTKLSKKTTKIMSDYQAYLAEIETEFPSEEGGDPALAHINATRDDIRGSYHDSRGDAEEGTLPPVREEGYATGAGQSLARSWNWSSKDGSAATAGLTIDRTGGYGDDELTNDFESLVVGQSYTSSWFRSKRVKRGICMIVGLASIAGVSVGLTRISKNKSLDSLEKEMNEAEVVEGASPKEGGTGESEKNDSVADYTPDQMEKYNVEMLYQNSVLKYKPKEFDRSTGWEGETYDDALNFCATRAGEGYALCPFDGVCPAGHESEPSGGFRESPTTEFTEWIWIPIMDRFNEWVQVGKSDSCIEYSIMHQGLPDWGVNGGFEEVSQNIMCCLGGEMANQIIYDEAMEKYHPREYDRSDGWKGSTFQQGVEFCRGAGEDKKEKYDLCNFDTICPLGYDTAPLGGVKGGDKASNNEAWIPVLDRFNEWVQVGGVNTCIMYSHEHPDDPEWGLTGALELNEPITRNIMCCLVQEETAPEEAALLYEISAAKWDPHWFDRSKGWTGQTFLEALDFCGDIDGFSLCPLEAICPLGPDSEPTTAYTEGPFAWVPITDSANEWVQIAREDSCNLYSQMNHGAPTWGMNGIGNEELTRNVMCCAEPRMGADGMLFIVEQSHKPLPPPPEVLAPPPEDDEETLLYMAAATKYEPRWYDRQKGSWEGQTYLQALEFCDATPPNGSNGKTYEVCPLEAICPLGPGTEPLAGYREEPNGSWVPIMDNPNAWVQVGSMDSCITYDKDNNHPTPYWGITGEGDEDVTRHVACCMVQDDDNGFVTLKDPEESSSLLLDSSSPTLAGTQGFDNTAPATEGLVSDVVPVATQGSAADAIIEAVEEGESLPSSGEMEVYLDAANKYMPEWHDRNEWKGQTYIEAVEWCTGKDGYDLCPFSAICPLGGDSQPLGGFRVEPNDSWVPISDGANDWVQVSNYNESSGTCLRWSAEHPELPEWGLTAENNEDITRHVVCCKVQEGDWAARPSQMMTLATTTTTETAAATTTTAATTPKFTAEVVTAAPEEKADDGNGGRDDAMEVQLGLVYKTVSEKYQPKWFDRTKGWNGQTYMDAFAFCEDFNGQIPCPYDAICPLGKGSKPLGGYRNDPQGSWAPLMDGPNEWVQLSEEASCVQWSHLHPGPPAWGETGEGNEEITRHVACCLDLSATPDPTNQPTPPPTPEPTPLPTMKPTPAPTPEPTETPTLPPTSKPTEKPTLPPTSKPTEKPTLPPTVKPTAPKPTPLPTFSDEYYYKTIDIALEPLWYDRSRGWDGKTYLEGLQFCAKQDSRVPCPYIAYCPIGTSNHPLGGTKEGVSWAPIIDSPNAWVQVGEESMCELYSDLYKAPPQWGLNGENSEDLTRHIMCCLEDPEPPVEEPEEEVVLTETERIALEVFKPQWYGREEGYQGGTYLEAAHFCESIAGMDLCPTIAFCPNGPLVKDPEGKPLFLQEEAFPGEQWAPVKAEVDGEDDVYLLVGTINDNPTTTCHTYSHFHDGEAPQWGIDGTRPDLKEYVMCCKNPDYVSMGISNPTVDLSIGGPVISSEELNEHDFNMEKAIENNLHPEWLDFSDGWIGGSHQDAIAFCAEERNGKQICPYAAYCPHGPGQSVSRGHSTDITAEGVQWAPVFGHENHWVMVGQKHGNSATTCFGHEDLEGGPPDWGLTVEQHEIKKHIMCCVIGNASRGS